MKGWLKLLICGAVSFVTGGAAGYFLRKKTAEVQFEVCSEEEIAKLMEENGEKPEEPEEQNKLPEITRPLDIQKMIDKNKDEQPGMIQMDTQKELYFQKWKAEQISEKYDTRTKEDPSDIGGEEEFDDEFLNGVDEEVDVSVGKADIEPGTIEDWDYWTSIPDGKFDAIMLNWYEQDNVLTDEHDERVDNPEKWVGPDVSKFFKDVAESTTDDPDIRVIINYKQKVIYQISRIHANYGQKKTMEEFGGDYDGDDESDWIRSRHE